MGPKWTCATSASWEVETPTPLILGRPTWPLLPSGLPSPPCCRPQWVLHLQCSTMVHMV